MKYDDVRVKGFDMYILEQMSSNLYDNHDCEMLSGCCGAERHEYVETMCGACNDHTGFECSICEESEP